MAMHLIIELDALLIAKEKSSNDIARATGHNKVNISKIRTGKLRGIRAGTLMDICQELDCQPGDILKIVTDEELQVLTEERQANREARLSKGLRVTVPERVHVIDTEDDED